MDNEGWIERWKRREIGFHQPHAHEQLTGLWRAVGVVPPQTVFVPLSGKSNDMVWLAERGHRIIGAELSEIAVREFFEELVLQPKVSEIGGFKVFEAGPYQIYCGDIFNLPTAVTKDVGAVYDRAALIAFPPDRQSAYAKKLAELVPATAPIFLVSLEYPANEISGPPFSVSESDLRALFAEHYEIEFLESRDGLTSFAADALKRRGVTRLDEIVYLLRRKS